MHRLATQMLFWNRHHLLVANLKLKNNVGKKEKKWDTTTKTSPPRSGGEYFPYIKTAQVFPRLQEGDRPGTGGNW